MDVASWKRLSQAIEFYTARGYTYVDAPWAVRRPVMDMTCPRPDLASPLGEKFLVGSAEQSFLDLEIDVLGKGRFVALTPCFRVADEGRSPLHDGYFMKVELYANLTENRGRVLNRMIDDAMTCFRSFGAGDLDVYNTFEQDAKLTRDIVMRGVEIGSYGMRTRRHPVLDEDHTWVYGTGLAEPRFSRALQRL
ncbi:hypothetical protein CcrC1_gp134 [Caulobacter phage C1]|nr:hypothetical protein CcrC1_gp134 [Caulobacter phage C1]UTU08363.1 hypothetical protein CcrC2_gp135 [Caulobacter phage C2]UTU08880.1 hypothetical protein CcrJ4_gp129 [Caulobacter phage J4]UTU09436.1 hypothetical protein CcrBL47_gp150 [Caulobacter phage BL47]UTU09996.1 hypothetical protein CcrRB23_gp134 [Caulobacter phage RB23]WGN97021.1 hypothetical protein [Bertelyvirus sp.]